MDWDAWHRGYDCNESSISRRLLVVQERISEVLDACPPGPIKVVSVCSGHGQDLIGVLSKHPRAVDVSARMVELNPQIASEAQRAAVAAGVNGIEVIVGDAASTSLYDGMVPADLVLMCGVWGNITVDDIKTTIDYCTELCRRGGVVVWTRHRGAPDLVPQICQWLEARGFEQQWLSEPDAGFGVGMHRFAGDPRPLTADGHMFAFARFEDLTGQQSGGK